MHILCNREKFAQAFQMAASVAAQRDVKPILQNVKIRATKHETILMAADSEFSIRIPVADVEIKEAGESILPTRQIKRILQESHVQTLELKTEKDKLIAKGDGFLFKLDGQDPSEFPDVSDFTEDAYHIVSGKIMREIVKRTSYAVDPESTRYMLGGILLDLQDGTLDAVATDSRRLSHQPAAAQSIGGHVTEKSAIFPPKILNLLEKACVGESDVQIAVKETLALMKVDGIVFSSRLIEGRFPRWRHIIPEIGGKAKIEIVAGALLNAVRQAAIVTSDKAPGVFLSFGNGKLEIRGVGAEIGESNIEIPISYSGDPISVKLDPSFVEDFLRTLDSSTVVSVYLSGDDPVLFRTEDDYTYVVMPLS